MDTTTTQAPFEVQRKPWPRTALLAGAGLAIAGVGLAAGLMLRSPQQPAAADIAAAGKPQALVSAEGAKAGPGSAARKAPAESAGRTAGGQPIHLDTQPAANTCTNCGVVEGVRAYQRKGEASGVGAVAGGVIGGALGNQVGKGNGRTAMTVIGAVGGGMAGHEIEKRAKSETWYEVRVRMDDGTVRTFNRKTAPAPGERVIVEGTNFRSAGATPQQPQDAPRTVRVSAGT